MAFYEQHLFFCTNQKAGGKTCCGQERGESAAEYVKSRLKAQDRHGAGKIRVSRAGCLGRCARGPCMVVYPQGDWYTYENTEDLEEILTRALGAGEPVERLKLPEIE